VGCTRTFPGWDTRFNDSLRSSCSATDCVAEAAWGADPLEFYGGFRKLNANADDTYPSSLAFNGTIGWSKARAKTYIPYPGGGEVDFKLEFPHIDWQWLRSFYGWAAFQYQAWARGSLCITGSEAKTVVLFTDNILEFCIDGHCHFGGDFYALRRAPSSLMLSPGPHQLDLRLIRDVRSMGGSTPPDVKVHLEAGIVSPDLHLDGLRALFPEYVDGRGFAGSYASIPARNFGDRPIRIVYMEASGVKFCNARYSSG